MNRLLLTLLLCASALMAFAQKDLKSGIGIYYREYSYHPDKPILVYLHGAGERGNTLSDLKLLNNIAFTKEFVPRHKDKFTILVPQQNTARWSWDQHESMHGSRFIEWAIANYKTSDPRVYVTGHSMGGQGAWDVACNLKNKITAIAVSAGSSLNYAGVVGLGEMRFPAIHFHGSFDNTENSYAKGQQVTRWYRTGSGDDILVTYQGAGHGIDTRVYRDENLAEWFLSHGKQPEPQPAPEPEPEQPEPDPLPGPVVSADTIFVSREKKAVVIIFSE